jgi:riboflavin kinase/FMN adenylyltransferase
VKGFPAGAMKIKVTQLADAERRSRQMAIGVFDGVHLGHRQVIEGADTVLTFEPHPLRVLHPEAAPKLIMPFEIKRDVVEGLGIEELIVIPFDDEFSSIAAEDFCSRILIQELGARSVSVGENFRFGARAKGDPQMLASREEFETRVVPLVEVDGEIVSSTRVRSLVAAGETGRGLLVEAFLIDYDGDLYGRTLRIAFISRLRGERRFAGVDELIAQMHQDVEMARELCASFTPP